MPSWPGRAPLASRPYVSPRHQRGITGSTAEGAQTVVDERSQVVLTSVLRHSGADCPALPGLLAELTMSLADNVTAVTEASMDPLIATGRQEHREPTPAAPRGRSRKIGRPCS